MNDKTYFMLVSMTCNVKWDLSMIVNILAHFLKVSTRMTHLSLCATFKGH